MTDKRIIKRLKALREEFGDHILAAGMAAPVAMILNDVCQALELAEEEREEVLGKEVVEVIERWLDSRIWVLTKKGNGSQILQRVDRQTSVAKTLLSHFARKRRAQKDVEDLFGKEE